MPGKIDTRVRPESPDQCPAPDESRELSGDGRAAAAAATTSSAVAAAAAAAAAASYSTIRWNTTTVPGATVSSAVSAPATSAVPRAPVPSPSCKFDSEFHDSPSDFHKLAQRLHRASCAFREVGPTKICFIVSPRS